MILNEFNLDYSHRIKIKLYVIKMIVSNRYAMLTFLLSFQTLFIDTRGCHVVIHSLPA